MNKLAKGEKPEKFVYNHLGHFTYIGNYKSIGEILGKNFSGYSTWFAWRSYYFSNQVSWRNRACIAFDWAKAFLFGRDFSRH